MDEQQEAPGWDAIDTALAPAVGQVQPLHWGTDTLLPDQDGLWGISAYPLDGYWLFVTYGLSELFVKLSDDPTVSGWGYELTMRVPRDASDDQPPGWPLNLLTRLGQVTYQQSQPHHAGGRMELPEAPDGMPEALLWAEDPAIGGFTGPFGSVDFLAVIGVSAEVLAEARATSSELALAALAEDNPLLISRF